MTLPNHKTFSLVLLMLIFALGYVDRMALGVVLQAIKLDLHLTDTQLGLVNGLAFSLFFSLMGIPIARWADRGDRVAILALSTAVWSMALALSALAGSFLQLVIIRMAVAIGDAGSGPPANSLIPDYFPRADRPRAVARYMLGAPIGIIVGYLAGGWLSQLYGWRATFLIIGLPGLALSLLAAWLIHEPRRQPNGRRVPVQQRTQTYSLKDVAVALVRNTTFRRLLAYFIVWYFCGWAIQLWLPAFLIRSHGLTPGELGSWLAFVYGGAGLLGTWLGGEWCSRYVRQDERAQLLGGVAMMTVTPAVTAAALVVASHYWAFAWLAIAELAANTVLGPIFATIQTLVRSSMRATAVTLVSVLPAIIGMGLGPFLAGTLSDILQPSVGDESLRYTLLAFTPAYLLAAWHLYRASQSVTLDIAAAEATPGCDGATWSVRTPATDTEGRRVAND